MFTLFNLQGTLAVSEVLFRTSPLIIAFCQPLVKYFFQSFSSFSDFFLSSPAGQKRTEAFLRPLCWRYVSSRSVTRQVLSAQTSLTSVFGMGTGGPSLQSTPTISFQGCTLKTEHQWFLFRNLLEVLSLLFLLVGQALGLLVSVSLMCYHTYTSDLSTT